MSDILVIILASLIVSLISFSGTLLLLIQKKLETLIPHLVSFAAGIMLTTAILELLPESIEGATAEMNIFIPVLLGIVVFFFLERFVIWFHHHHESHNFKPSTLLILIGDGVHNFIDGVAIAAAFITNPSLGIATTAAIAAHEIPQEIADFSILVSGGISKLRALFYNFVSGLTALLGAVIGFYFLERIEGSVPILLAFTAGMFIYIACSDLIPEMHKEFLHRRSWVQSIPFIFGIILAYSFISLLHS